MGAKSLLPCQMIFPLHSPCSNVHYDCTQLRLGNQLDITQLVPEVSDANVNSLELVTSQRGIWIPPEHAAMCLK